MAIDENTIILGETGQALPSLPRLRGSIDIGDGKSGEICLSDIHSDQERLADYLIRQQRDLEWIALKAWWASSRELKRAKASGNLQRITKAHQQRRRVIVFYGPALKRARLKWRQAQRERDERRRHLTEPL